MSIAETISKEHTWILEALDKKQSQGRLPSETARVNNSKDIDRKSCTCKAW